MTEILEGDLCLQDLLLPGELQLDISPGKVVTGLATGPSTGQAQRLLRRQEVREEIEIGEFLPFCKIISRLIYFKIINLP